MAAESIVPARQGHKRSRTTSPHVAVSAFALLSPASTSAQPLGTVQMPIANQESTSWHVVDGPRLVLFSASDAQLQVLAVSTATAAKPSPSLVVAQSSRVDLSVEAEVKLQSCCLVQDLRRSHLRLHFVERSDAQSQLGLELRGGRHWWKEWTLGAHNAPVVDCAYVLSLASPSEQVTACCVVELPARADDWAAGDPVQELQHAWTWLSNVEAENEGSVDTDTSYAAALLSPSSLLVLGTSSNSLQVFQGGVLFNSFVLPETPATIQLVEFDGAVGVSGAITLCVTCDDVERTALLVAVPLKLRSPVQLLHHFSVVGSAWVGDFYGDGAGYSHVLLLNSGLATTATGHEQRHEQQRCLLHKSALLVRKADAQVYVCHKITCDANPSSAVGSKRSRGDSKSQRTPCIRRIKVDKNLVAAVGSASTAHEDEMSPTGPHIERLTTSLAQRLSLETEEHARLEAITRDKMALLEQLNQLLLSSWQRSFPVGSPSLDVVRLSPKDQPGSPQVQCTDKSAIALERVVGAAPAQPNVTQFAMEWSCSLRMTSFRVVEMAIERSVVRLQINVANESQWELKQCQLLLTSLSSMAPSEASSCIPLFQAYSSVMERLGGRSLTDKEECSAQFFVELEMHPQMANQHPCVLSVAAWLRCVFTQDDSPATTQCTRLGVIDLDIMELMRTPLPLVPRTAVFKGKDEVLLISQGTSLTSWLARPATTLPSLPGIEWQVTIARPTFAILALHWQSEQVAARAWTSALSCVPVDVVLVRNPFAQDQLETLMQIVKSLRNEIKMLQLQSRPNAQSEGGAAADRQNLLRQQQQTDRAALSLLCNLECRSQLLAKCS